MLFAIEEINNNTDLLPGVSLGYKIYDACGSIARGVRVALALANGNGDASPPSEVTCTRPAQVQAIMGETSSSPCMAIATVIGPFYIPLVGWTGKNLKIMYFPTQRKCCSVCVKILYFKSLSRNLKE